MIQFILNDSPISTALPPGMTLLDFIRYQRHLTGTKIGCREGDCGACTVLVGEIVNVELNYRSVTSCLMPLANAHGKHIVTIEGINGVGLNPVQQAMSDEGATQCGFCTPGFVMSLAGFSLQNKSTDVVAAIDGNICRCTGYKSIERAAIKIAAQFTERGSSDFIQYAIEKNFIPPYFSTIKKRLMELLAAKNGSDASASTQKIFVGGGTDLYVQRHEEMVNESSDYLSVISSLKGVRQDGNEVIVGATSTVTDLIESVLFNKVFPDFLKYSKLVSSTPIRNMATIGGNFVNASPIGDFTVFFLALDPTIVLTDNKTERQIKLRQFYKGYKSLDKKSDEYIKEIRFAIPQKNTHFHFEKVSKRTNLDIASVNSAIMISVTGDMIDSVSVSAGGVGPIPMHLKETSAFLSGKKISVKNIIESCGIAGEEISPISDARGTAGYKLFLLQQLIKAHFITLFPALIQPQKLLIHEEY